jgi:ABC-type transport system involved in multi-copper enzyme maturation permease subunit
VTFSAFRSEWIKLRRPTLLLGTYGAIAAVTALLTILTFARAGHHARFARAAFISLAALAAPDGIVHAFTRGATLLGIIALAVAGAQLASEYSLGTLHNLLIRQLRRPILLAGKYLAVLSFMIGAVVLACVVGGVAAFVMAHVRGIPTAAWTSSAGLHQIGQALGDVALSVCGYATLGMVFGIVFRSPVAAITIGIVYILPFESILSATVSGSDRWLPGQLLDAIAQGGTSDIGFATALVTGLLYLVGLSLVGLVLFTVMDVTA